MGRVKPPEQAPAESSRDVVLLGSPTADRGGVTVLRARGEAVELGEVRPLAAGQPITGDVVKLVPRKGQPRICDVETQLSKREIESARANALGAARPSQLATERGGPPQVATQRYRDNWEAVYRARRSSADSADLN
jgi:hypothetical protein